MYNRNYFLATTHPVVIKHKQPEKNRTRWLLEAPGSLFGRKVVRRVVEGRVLLGELWAQPKELTEPSHHAYSLCYFMPNRQRFLVIVIDRYKVV